MTARHIELSDGRILTLFDTPFPEISFSVTSETGATLVARTPLANLDPASTSRDQLIYFSEDAGGGLTFYRNAGNDPVTFDTIISQQSFDASGAVTAPVMVSDRMLLTNFEITNSTRPEYWTSGSDGVFFVSSAGVTWVATNFQGAADSAFIGFDQSAGFDGDTIINTQQGFVVAGLLDANTPEFLDPATLTVSFINREIVRGDNATATPSQIQFYANQIDLTTPLLTGNQEFRQNALGGANGPRFNSIDTLQLGNGNILIVWSGFIVDGPGSSAGLVSEGIYAAIVSENGGIVTNPYLMVAGPEADTDGGFGVSGNLFRPELYDLQDGSYALVYQADTSRLLSDADAFVRHFSADGTLLQTVRYEDTDARDIMVSPTGAVFSIAQTGTTALAGLNNVGEGPAQPVNLTGTDGNDLLEGGGAADRLDGLAGDDTLNGGDGADTLIGGAGDDSITGGTSTDDLRDIVFGGAGNDTIDGGYGNDELRGDAGNDSIAGGFGADTVIGGAGDDTLTGSAFGDLIFGGDGFDFINGGFGSDRVNGGADGDRFFHLGVADHGSDWIQDYNAADGDVLVYGGSATRDQFQVNVTNTANAGADGVDEAFVIYRPTGQILWALVDGDGQSSINLRLGGQEFDLLA